MLQQVPETRKNILSDKCFKFSVIINKLKSHIHLESCKASEGFPGGSEVKAPACNAGDLGSIPGSGRFPGEGNGNPLQYSCLENPMDRGAWWATVHGVPKSWTQLSNFTFQGFRSSGNNGSFFPSHRKTVSNQKSYARTEENKKKFAP